MPSTVKFQSPPPMREATYHFGRNNDPIKISIPASHAGGDDVELQVVFASLKRFQSPPPMREATWVFCSIYSKIMISIPASHAGGDGNTLYNMWVTDISIPASHAGGDQDYREYHIARDISIPASHAGGDLYSLNTSCVLLLFQSPPPMREAT